MISETEYVQAIAEFLSEKGVTRCPTVCVAPTRASVSDADRVALRSHAEIREAVRRSRRRELQQMVAPRRISREDYAAVAAPPVSDPHSEACVSP
jgi:hypothetical protein